MGAGCARGSRPVLREAQGETPWAYSPDGKNSADTALWREGLCLSLAARRMGWGKNSLVPI